MTQLNKIDLVVNGPWLDVRNYGAQGDGVTDDTAAINAAIAALGGKARALYFPSGNYVVSSQLSAIPANIRVYGDGATSILSGTLSSGGAVFETVASNVIFEKLNLQVVCRTGIFIEASNVTVRDCIITNCTLITGPFGIDAGQLGGILFQDSNDCWVIGNTCFGNGLVAGSFGGHPTGYGTDIGTYNGSVANNRIHIINNDCSSSAVLTNIGIFAAKTGEVSGNHCRNAGSLNPDGLSGGYGIVVYNFGGFTYGDNWVIANNIVTDTAGSGIYIQSNKNTTITGNYVRNTCLTEGPGTLLVAGIACNLGPSTISGNVVESSNNDGIAIQGDFHTVSGNAIYSPAANGVNIYNGKNCVIDAVTVYNPGATKTFAGGIVTAGWYGQAIAVPIYQCTISNCSVFGNGRLQNIVGFGLGDMHDSIVHDNNAYDMGSVGFEFQWCNEINVHDNRVQDCNVHGTTNCGIQVTDSSHMYFHDNKSLNVFGSTQQYGLVEADLITQTPPDYNRYVNNDFSYNSTGGMSLLGAHNQLQNNQTTPSFTNGTVTLVGGTLTVSNSSIAIGDEVLLTRKTVAGTPGNLAYTLSPGTGFTISSYDGSSNPQTLDTSIVAYQIKHADPAGDVLFINVKDYGATGDGIDDDTVAIQSAINTAGVAGGDVYFPIGTYKVTSTLAITGSVNNISLVGVGKGGSILLNKISSSSAPLLKINASGNFFRIEGLQFKGNNLTGSSGNGNAISIINPGGPIFFPEQVIIRDCIIWNHRGQGVDSANASLPTGSAGIYLEGGTALNIESTYVAQCGVGLFGDNVQKAGAHFATFDACDSNAMYLRTCEQWSFDQCIFNASGGAASTNGDIYMNNCNVITFQGCRIKDGGPYCVNLLDGNAVNKSISFYGCHFDQLGSSGTGFGQIGIKASNACNGLVVDGCSFDFVNTDTAAIGIDLEQGAAGFEAVGHVYRSNTFSIGTGGTIAACFKLNVSSNAACGTLIEGNTIGFFTAGGATTISKGIHLAGNCKSVSIRNNSFISDGVNLTITNGIFFDVGSNILDTLIDGNVYSPFGGITTKINDSGSAGVAYNRVNEGAVSLPVQIPVRFTPSNGGTITPDCAVGRTFIVTMGSGVSSISIDNPANFWVAGDGAQLKVIVKNASGGSIFIGWGSNIKQSFTLPMDGFNRTFELTFDLNAVTWYQTGETHLDIPN